MLCDGAAEDRTEVYRNTLSTNRRPATLHSATAIVKAWFYQVFTIAACLFWSQKVNGAISTLPFHTLRHFHVAPINQIVSLGPHREI